MSRHPPARRWGSVYGARGAETKVWAVGAHMPHELAEIVVLGPVAHSGSTPRTGGRGEGTGHGDGEDEEESVREHVSIGKPTAEVEAGQALHRDGVAARGVLKALRQLASVREVLGERAHRQDGRRRADDGARLVVESGKASTLGRPEASS